MSGNRKDRSPQWKSWAGMLYYGEAFGFVFAWIAGIAALAAATADDRSPQPAVDQVAAADVAPAANGDRSVLFGVR
ncbi:MAG: hypothetical protein AAF805_04910 [Planctomycetota bacterium]